VPVHRARARTVLTFVLGVATTIVLAVTNLGGFADYLSRFKEFSISVYEDVRGRRHEAWYFGLSTGNPPLWQPIWIRESDGKWTERYPDSRPSSTYEQTGRYSVNGCEGTVLRRTREFGAEVFIPDIGCNWMEVLARPPGTTTWPTRLGKMTYLSTSQATATRMAAERIKDVPLWGPTRARGWSASHRCECVLWHSRSRRRVANESTIVCRTVLCLLAR